MPGRQWGLSSLFLSLCFLLPSLSYPFPPIPLFLSLFFPSCFPPPPFPPSLFFWERTEPTVIRVASPPFSMETRLQQPVLDGRAKTQSVCPGGNWDQGPIWLLRKCKVTVSFLQDLLEHAECSLGAFSLEEAKTRGFPYSASKPAAVASLWGYASPMAGTFCTPVCLLG